MGSEMCIRDRIKEGEAVAYPERQVYGSLALEDNSEVGEAVLGRCSISCVCTSANEADPQLAMSPSGRGQGNFPHL